MTARHVLAGTLVAALVGALLAWRWQLQPGEAGPAVPAAEVLEGPPSERPTELSALSPVESPSTALTQQSAPPESTTRQEAHSSSPQSSQLRTALRAAKAHFDLCQDKLNEDPAVAAMPVVTLSILLELDRAGRFEPLPEKFATSLGDPVDGVLRIPLGERVYAFRADEFREYETLKALIEARTEQRAAVVARLQLGELPPTPSYDPLPAELVAAVEEYAARAAP